MKWGLLLIVCSLAVGGLACDQADPESLAGRWNTLRQACKHKDVGAILEIVDRTYQDDLGGVGRLEDDLRQLFLVYGKIDLELFDGRFTEQGLSGRLAVRGRKLEFEGPVSLKFSENLLGKLLVSGFLTDLRGILDTLRQRRHQLHDRSQSFDRGADAGPDEPGLRDRGVDHSIGTEFAEEIGGGSEDPAVSANVFTHDEDVRVAAHLERDAFGHCLGGGDSAGRGVSTGHDCFSLACSGEDVQQRIVGGR